ncbi:MAG: hypothetical protein H0V35_10040 [Nitrospira sp.]|nr:hypothetical protein [Nitrospira sp.]
MRRFCFTPGTTRTVLMLVVWLIGLLSPSGQAHSATTRTYEFKVLLDGDEIGRQRFDVSSDGPRTQVRVEAGFTVKFLLITVYTYRHSNVESWEGSCLREITAETNDNGELFFVKSTSHDAALQWQTQAGRRSAEGCVKTFAYWNPAWLTGDRLLNSQTGELDAAEILTVGGETISVRGAPTRTTHRRIVTGQFTIDLWYDLNGEWVALQSTTQKGHTLFYMLQ